MNILIITQYFWPETFRINDLAEGLVARGHQVTVLTGKPNYPSGRFYPGYNFLNKRTEKYGEIDVVRVPLISRGSHKIRLALNYASFAFFASISGVLRCKRPDVIFVYEPSPITVGLPAIFFKKIKKTPILFWVQDLWPESVAAVDAVRSKSVLKWISYLVRFIYTRCDYILTTSKSYFESIQQFDVPSEKLRYFPQTAEALFKPVAAETCQKEAQLMPAGFRIVFSGNIGSAQDVETIMGAARLLKHEKEIQWIFLGDGSKRKWLQEEIEREDLSTTVHWLGQHPVETMPCFFAQSDVMLVTLKNDPVFSLTIPAKIQSYLACAKPILGAIDGEGRQVIEEAKAGMVVSSGDSQALAQSALAMYKLSAMEREQMGQHGRRYFEQHFHRDVLLQNLEGWMMELKEQYS